MNDLPRLLNSSKKRKRSLSNYIAPVNLRNTIYQCQEFPDGVFINRYGEICPNSDVSIPPIQNSDFDEDSDTKSTALLDEDYSEPNESSSESEYEENSSSEDVSISDFDAEHTFQSYLKRKRDRIFRFKLLDFSQKLALDWDNVESKHKYVTFSPQSDIFGSKCIYNITISNSKTQNTCHFDHMMGKGKSIQMQCTSCRDTFTDLEAMITHNSEHSHNES